MRNFVEVVPGAEAARRKDEEGSANRRLMGQSSRGRKNAEESRQRSTFTSPTHPASADNCVDLRLTNSPSRQILEERLLSVRIDVVRGTDIADPVFFFGRKKKKNWPDTLQWIRKSFPKVPQLPCVDLAAWLEDTSRTAPVLLDVRDADEFTVSHLPGARHVPPESDPTSVLSDLSRDQPIVAYCASGFRSSRFAQKLLDAGFQNVANLEGSIFQWANEGRPIVVGSQPTDKVHACDAAWGELLQPELRYLPKE